MERHITHLIIGLGKGGAETMLYQVLRYRTDPALVHHVISLGASHYYEPHIKALGVDLLEYDLRKHPMQTLWRVYQRLLHKSTLCCWMYHANFLGYFLGKAARVPNVIWCIHHSSLEPELNKKRTLQLSRFCARHSAGISAIAYSGNRAREVHEAAGYCHERGRVLDNGCDCGEYAPVGGAKEQLQRELSIPPGKKVILSVTKDHPIKDVPTFLKAFGILRGECPNVAAILCGDGVRDDNRPLVSACEENGLSVGADIFLLGVRHDLPMLFSACDLFVLHSAGEAFPNVLIQAMSCGCVCLTTDVGDARRILGQEEWVVPVGDAEELWHKMRELLTVPAETAENIKQGNRACVLEHYNIQQIVEDYEELF